MTNFTSDKVEEYGSEANLYSQQVKGAVDSEHILEPQEEKRILRRIDRL